MTAKQYREAVEQLGLSTQAEAAEFLGISLRTSHSYANGTARVPEAVAKLLHLMVRRNIKPADTMFRT